MMFDTQITRNKMSVIGIVLFMLLSFQCMAQNLKEVGHIWAMKGTVQLLPTGEVLKREEGKTTLYVYLRDQYVANKVAQVPERLANWSYFDWLSVDWHDQLDRNDSDIPDAKFWPEHAKVKKLIYLSARNAPVVTVLVCYTLSEQAKDARLGPSKQILIVAIRGNMTDNGYVYHELWTRTLKKDSCYGELTVQEVPGLGRALVLYSASAGPSSESEQLDIYRLN